MAEGGYSLADIGALMGGRDGFLSGNGGIWVIAILFLFVFMSGNGAWGANVQSNQDWYHNFTNGKVYKYTVGESTDYNAVLRLRREVAASFPQAFVIAFRDGVRMDINEAIREFKSRKKR